MLRLAAFLACVGLATSRLGLVVHEFLGHGGAALAVGGTVNKVQLFWFAGGWIQYQVPPTWSAHVLVALGGCASELLIALPLWFATKQPILRAAAAAIIAHATWYLSAGTWHGFGDGNTLYQAFGDWRWRFAIAAGAGCVAIAFFGARHVFGTLRAFAGHRWPALIGALVLAAAVNAGLMIGELRVRRDFIYTAITTSESTRVVERELRALPPEQREQMRPSIEAQHQDFPFKWILAALILAALALGARASARSDRAPPRIDRIAILAAASIALVMVIDYASS